MKNPSSLTSSSPHVGSKDAWPADGFPQDEEAASVSSTEEPSAVLFPVGASRGGASPKGGVATDSRVEVALFWLLPGKLGRGIEFAVTLKTIDASVELPHLPLTSAFALTFDLPPSGFS